MATTKRKKASKKKASKKKASKEDQTKKREAARKKHAAVRKRLVDKFAGESATIDGIDKKLREITGRGLASSERSEASLKLAEKVLRGSRRR